MSLLTILIFALVFCVIFGGFGHGRMGPVGWSPAGVIVLVLLVLWLTGNLHR